VDNVFVERVLSLPAVPVNNLYLAMLVHLSQILISVGLSERLLI
jgi:hypothetical protein